MSRGDYHLYVLMHELAHFVDDEKRVEIADHHLCVRTADLAGQDRMRAIYPNLPIEIYTDVT